jgi:hypothetical protein
MTRALLDRLREIQASEFTCDPAIAQAIERIKTMENVMETLSHIHDGNPSDAMADMPPLDYARHMLWEARRLAREALAQEPSDD